MGGITVGLAVDEPIVEVVERLTRRGVIFHGPIRDDGGLKLRSEWTVELAHRGRLGPQGRLRRRVAVLPRL